MINGLTNSGSIPVLERMMQFTSRRQEIISHNIANLSTPGFRPQDVSVEGFQKQLAEAIDDRRTQHGNAGGELKLKDSPQVQVKSTQLQLNPEPTGDNILLHDRNDRDLDRTMQDMVENFMAFRAAAQFMRREFETLQTAIRERM